MAYVSGPCSTLPGHTIKIFGEECDNHQGRHATHRVQGETDSFGCEGFDFCQECYDNHLAEVAKHAVDEATGMCDWCKNPATDLRPRRDFEEGLAGPVYRVCGACVKRENEALAEERNEHDDFNDDWDQSDCYDPCLDSRDDD